jgi:pimeloyl-ACP methyl ester carboxylesterase
MLTEKSFNTGTITINYAEGSPNGSPLVMLHGGTARWQELLPLITELEKDWHIYACDKRGHGKSSRGDSYRVVDFGNDMAEFIKRNIGERVVLLGHSGGAVASLVAASQIPDLIQKLIVLDPPIFLREESIKSIPIYNYFLGVYHIVTHQRTAREVFSEFFQGIDEAGIRYLDEMVNVVDPEFLKTLLEDHYFDDMHMQAVLEKITCPTLMLYGEIDKGAVVRDRDVEFFKAHISNGTAIQIKDAGHLLHADQPAKVLELIDQWLKN